MAVSTRGKLMQLGNAMIGQKLQFIGSDRALPHELRNAAASRAAGRSMWIIGAALLVTVVIVALHHAEAEEFVRLAEKAEPWWLLLALVFQAGTYLAHGEVIRRVVRAAKFPLRVSLACQISLAKLFVDQALPSAGLSGTFVITRALERRGLARPLVAATMVVDLVSYYAAYVLSLSAGLLFAAAHGELSTAVLSVAVLFGSYAVTVSFGMLMLSGRTLPSTVLRLTRFRPLRAALKFVADAEGRLVRNSRLLPLTIVHQLAIFALDAGTVWVLLKALGTSVSASAVFTSFMASTLFRSVGILPGGLGSFEAASVLMLKTIGVPMAAALSATLLFRGLSFWLPMLPGFWCSRRLVSERFHATAPDASPFWAGEPEALFRQLECDAHGLSTLEARSRLERRGPHRHVPRVHGNAATLLLAQFKSPIVALLLCAAALSLFLRDPIDALLIICIVAISALLGFWQEKGASDAAAHLLALVQVNATALRDGREVEIVVEEIVSGDVVVLNAGDVVPADGRLLESKDLFVDEATLTGETFPIEKSPAAVPPAAPLSRRTNVLFMGTHVVSGTGALLAVNVGRRTEFGKIAETLRLRPVETEFERGVRRFGYFLLELTLVLVLGIFALNVYLARPVLDALLFALALAVGLTPQLLPAIISVNLAHGAKRMAEHRVIIKRLAAIENFASMTVLCCDKTGTLTEGKVRLESAVNVDGLESPRVLLHAALNAAFQTGYANPMDAAIAARSVAGLEAWHKLDEEPYDFFRRRISVLVARGHAPILVTKGALPSVLSACTTAELPGGATVPIGAISAKVEAQLQDFSARGWRVLGLAFRPLPTQTRSAKTDEAEMTFLGLLAFSDPLKENIAATLDQLRASGVAPKIVTGDHHLVALDVARRAGFSTSRWLTGTELRTMSDTALRRRVNDVDVFAEVEPDQKERLILALRKSGQVVGYIGDGINDASALHVADVGISVAGAADVAQQAADIVMLEKDLAVLERGVHHGRITFANTLKYVFMATSANFGNMFSMAAASLFIPFLPLLPKQILLLNLLTDLPEMAIATDRVDEEWTRRPRRWNIAFIRRFMTVFGLLSSVFDFLTFAALLRIFHVAAPQFRSAWFVGSVISAALILLVIRARCPVFQSRPSSPLLWATAVVGAVATLLPFTPAAAALELAPLPGAILAFLLGNAALYAVAAEATKRWFYRHAPLG